MRSHSNFIASARPHDSLRSHGSIGSGRRGMRVMMRARAVVVSPNASNDRISRCKETKGSPASILATRDWFDCSRFANST